MHQLLKDSPKNRFFNNFPKMFPLVKEAPRSRLSIFQNPSSIPFTSQNLFKKTSIYHSFFWWTIVLFFSVNNLIIFICSCLYLTFVTIYIGKEKRSRLVTNPNKWLWVAVTARDYRDHDQTSPWPWPKTWSRRAQV